MEKKNAGYKIGDRVRHTCYNTLGSVLDIDPNGDVYVFWDNGTSGYYGEWNQPITEICNA